jgi:anti-sigma B factor antagonist
VKEDVISIQGRINVVNSGEMRRTLNKALRQLPAKLTIDLSGVTYMDTSGLATLVEATRIARKQG